ncbi:MAG: hypothetical protein E6J87_26905 [Deltaproteobacteria bacterium]|nr:MAG: hypothetical protein E6J87_26905 [Deltaproteobacteria bacterium]
MAVEQQVNNHLFVERSLVVARARTRGEPAAQLLGQGAGALGDLDDIRRTLGLVPRVPERAGRVEVGAEHRALGLDSLGQERIAVRQSRDRARQRSLVLGREEHRTASSEEFCCRGPPP